MGVGSDGVRLVRPVDEVGGGAVSPRHVAPRGAVRVVLEIEVPLAVEVEHAVGVVHPPVGGRVVVSSFQQHTSAGMPCTCTEASWSP